VIYRLIADRAREAQYQLSEAGELSSGDLEVDISRLLYTSSELLN
jgi:hypothetical protein